MKNWIWGAFFDPLLRRLDSRIDHLRQGRAEIRDEAAWAPLGLLGQGLTIHEDAVLINNGPREAVQIGDRCRIYGQIWIFGAGRLQIGHHSFLGAGSRIWCAEQIRIGSHVLISHAVDIHDTSSHSLDWKERREEIQARFDRGDDSVPASADTAAIVIEDDVWIGFKATVLKGVTLGRGCVVAAGSVVTKDVAPFTLVGGNPAVHLRDLSQ